MTDVVFRIKKFGPNANILGETISVRVPEDQVQEYKSLLTTTFNDVEWIIVPVDAYANLVVGASSE